MKTGIRMLFWLVILPADFLPVNFVFAESCSRTAKDYGQARTAVLDYESLDVNRIECFIQNDGHFAEDPAKGSDGFFYPSGQHTRSLVFTAGLWVLGKVNGDIRSAACSYSSEFQPGPILADGTAGDTSSTDYRIYKYNKGETVDAEAMAQGCPSDVIGDQMLFCVFNDLTDHDWVWRKPPIGLEVQMTAFAFNRPGALENAIFIKYLLINKGGDDLRDAYAALFFDTDLGLPSDDYTGCDTTLGIAYTYNGDGFDEVYGVQVPALGCDILQGPLVPSAGDTASLFGGGRFPGMKTLGMTAYWASMCAAPILGMCDPILQDSQGAVEAYRLVSGFPAEGTKPWMDPSQDDKPTSFPLAGDPVAGTGWLAGQLKRPGDMKMGLSSGSFELGAGESQEVVFGIIVGQGSDHLNSITVLRYYDRIIKNDFKCNFKGAELDALPVQAVQMDRDLLLVWGQASENAFESAGYKFEGYNVWQAEQAEGPWKNVATVDKENGITVIRDFTIDESSGFLDETAVQQGSDSGLRNDFRIGKDYLGGGPLINGREYHFAVTAYGYNLSVAPRVLETPRATVTAVPQAPLLDVEYHSGILDTIPVTLEGKTDGKLVVEVIDPSALKGDAYELRFDSVMTGGGKKLVWSLVNKTSGEVILSEQVLKVHDDGDEDFPVVDGFKVKVTDCMPGIKAVVEAANPAGDPCGPNDVSPDGCDAYGNNVWHSLNSTGSYRVSAGGGTGDLDRLERYASSALSRDFEIRFTGEGGFAVYSLTDDRICAVPFELWDAGVGTPGDPSDDRRMIPFISANDSSKAFWGWANGVDGFGGWPCSDWIYFMDPEDAEGYAHFADVCARSGGAGATYPSSEDGSKDGYYADFHGGFVYPVARLVICSESGAGVPPAGTVIRILYKKTIQTGDVFSFSTADYCKIQSSEIAKNRLGTINVFPNPYYALAPGGLEWSNPYVTFLNLPGSCVVRIFSLSGRLVRTLKHENGTPFERWDLANEHGKTVGGGMYIALVQTQYGERTLKLAVVDR
jgi:hypothetical protein